MFLFIFLIVLYVFAADSTVSKGPEVRPCRCPEDGKGADQPSDPSAGGWSRNELMGLTLDPKLYSATTGDAVETPTARHQDPDPSCVQDLSEEPKKLLEPGRFKTTYTSSFCEVGYGGLLGMKDDLGQLECDAKSIQRPGDPCHYVPVRSAHRNLACKDALELSKSCQNGKDLLHPLGNEYQEKANLINMGGLIMRDKDHRHFT